MKWLDNVMCRERRACAACRSSRPFRESLFRLGKVPKVNFACPYLLGGWGLGTMVSWIAQPIAKAFKIPCGQPKSPCAKRKNLLNSLLDKRFDA